jgi:GIY-YIG catalytic domain
MYYVIYKIVNKTNNKIYIGSHKTKNLKDDYMGSGKYLKNAIKKNGIENFVKEIIHIFNTPEEMYAKEAEIVNEEFLTNENTYNLKIGGSGGFDYINTNGINGAKLAVVARTELMKNPDWYQEWHKKQTLGHKKYVKSVSADEWTRRGKQSNQTYYEQHGKYSFEGKTHSDSTKKTISDKAKGRTVGELNSQFGTMWVTTGTENRKIKKDAVIPEGWSKGRSKK